ncbi:hypothetical protein [Pseudorhodoferax soli]|nr:hypothetical protein [Pseudorhodoferax soli]
MNLLKQECRIGSEPKTSFLSETHLFPPGTVISRNLDGIVASIYGDDEWKYRYSDAEDVYETLKFHKGPTPLDALLREQNKGLMWCHIDKGRMRSVRTIRHSNYAVRAWCEICRGCGTDLFALLRDPSAVAGYAGSFNINYLSQTSALISTLARNRSRLSFSGEVPLKLARTVLGEELASRGAYRQTPLIPSNIYLQILSRLVSSLDEIEKDLDSLIPLYFNPKPVRLGPYTAKEYDSAGIPVEVESRLDYYQAVLMLCVVAFSGMRRSEASSIRLTECLREFEDGGSTHYEICGFTTKFNKGLPKPASWITSKEGARAVQLAQRISEAVVEKHGHGSSGKGRPYLFPTLSNSCKERPAGGLRSSRSAVLANFSPVIEQRDIDELNQLELARGWQREGIEVGSVWPLGYHQLRRSLSVYAHRSGMVSLPGLKAQLQHITDEMRAYYSDGFSRATNLVLDKDHFSHEWNAAKAESSFLAYTLGILLEGTEVFGRGADRMSNTLGSRTQGEALQLFERGQIAYRETVLGGCTSLQECSSTPLSPLPWDCVQKNCVNQVVIGKRLDHVIKTQESVVAALVGEQGSVEYRLEADNLRVLLQAREKFRS